MSSEEPTHPSSFDGWPLSGCTNDVGASTFYNCTWNPRERRMESVRVRALNHYLLVPERYTF